MRAAIIESRASLALPVPAQAGRGREQGDVGGPGGPRAGGAGAARGRKVAVIQPVPAKPPACPVGKRWAAGRPTPGYAAPWNAAACGPEAQWADSG